MDEKTRALWGKASSARKSMVGWHALACHMIDSAETAGWIWDEFLSPVTRSRIDAAAGGFPGGGRALLQFLAALHDLGKATPSFQVRNETQRAALAAAGLDVPSRAAESVLSHALLSGLLLAGPLREAGWNARAASWVALTAAGHHGVFPSSNWRDHPPYDWEAGNAEGPWAVARDELLAMVCAHLGLADLGPAVTAPDLPLQLVISGAVILADWIASNEEVFPYAGEWQDAYPAVAASRTADIKNVLSLRDKWQPDQPSPGMSASSLIHQRFELDSVRPIQEAACAMASEGRPGLMLIEAPMGEGKTEAALAAAEILAARTDADGLFIGLPSKATANQMFERVSNWLYRQPGFQVITLAHSGARRHQEFKELLEAGIGIDEGDCGVTASRWLFGSKKALLSPVTVGTIDQLLLAGVSSRHVALRHLGLAGKVVIIDEVHACDAYMSVILQQVVRWLGAARIPVIMLSATLAAGQRQELLAAYAGYETVPGSRADGYPRLSWVPAPERISRRPDRVQESPMVNERFTAATRISSVGVTMVDERDPDTVPALASELVSSGGCALVVRNTVRRAQDTYKKLRETVGAGNVALVHARFTVADRRTREKMISDMFGKDGKRPKLGHITVGTQVLEQSLDCDWDVLLTDLAPVDLLFQRLGRIHRHDRGKGSRGELTRPQVYVAGRVPVPGEPPEVPLGSSLVYSNHLLWRTEAVLSGRPDLDLPGDVPLLVDQVYGPDPLGPPEWQPAMEQAARKDAADREQKRMQAESIMLPAPSAASLSAVHDRNNVGDAVDEGSSRVQAHVRLGPPTIEVILLREADPDTAVTVSGDTRHMVSRNRAPGKDATDVVLDQMIRLPAQLTDEAEKKAQPVPAWHWAPGLAAIPVLFLPADGAPLRLGRYLCTYSPELGLEIANA